MLKLRSADGMAHDVMCQVWDTAGQERFHKITTAYYKGASGIVLVYDVTSRASFENVSYWMENIQRNTLDTEVILIANKVDLAAGSQPETIVSSAEGRAAAEAQGVHFFFECSAKSGRSVADAFHTITAEAFAASLIATKLSSSSGTSSGCSVGGAESPTGAAGGVGSTSGSGAYPRHSRGLDGGDDGGDGLEDGVGKKTKQCIVS